MATSARNPVTWEEIDLSESYLVCGMFHEAAALASSVLMRIHDNDHVNAGDNAMLHDMMESAATVLVQSLGESGRATELLPELKMYFGDVAAIPARVLLIGACILVAAGFTANVREFLEDFLRKWQFEKGKYFLDVNLCTHCSSARGSYEHPVLGVDEYMEVVDFYAVVLLGKILNDLDHAIFWVEKAQLPEEAREDLLRRLHSLFSLKTTSTSQAASVRSPPANEPGFSLLHAKEVTDADKSEMASSSTYSSGHAEKGKFVFKWQLKFRQLYHWFSWFHRATIRFGNAHLSLSTGNIILLWGLILITGYVVQKRRVAIMRLLRKRALSLKQSMIDLWRLAFSYQVNPLAAMQALPAPTPRGG
ncbi:hypothetical protein Dimus_020907 [Dionaea muscipula]